MKTLEYTQNAHACPRTVLSILLFAGWLLLLAVPKTAEAQTNDPKLLQQYYIFDHNIDQAWNYNTGSSNTRIAIQSMAGFTSTHEDLSGARYLNPWTEWLGPEHDYASEIAGIVGAQTNNNTGIAGIDWNSTMKSYNILRQRQSGDNLGAATFTYDGQDYYLDTGKLDAMVNQAMQDNMDIQVFTFGVPSAKTSDLKGYENKDLSGVLKFMNVPWQPPADPFETAFQGMITSLGKNLWNDITSNNYTPPTDLELFRQKLWEFSQPANNGVTLAPAGDLQNEDMLEILMPAAMDNYVVTVAGAEKDAGTYIQWSNSQATPYVDVAAAANNIVSISGTGYSAYNNDFNSTAASTGIVGGVTSLLKAENPNLTHDDIEQILERTAIDLEGPGHDNKTGHGFVDAQAALDFVQNNDIHHKQATNSNITILDNSEVNWYWTTMKGYLGFTSTNANSAQGKLKKITGEVEFDLPFSSTPKLWLRMTSSGIDKNIKENNHHWYDKYDKAFNVTSVTTTKFTFELYYWKVEFKNSLGQTVDTRIMPDVSNDLTIDYTVVGTQEEYWPVSVYISGLDTYSEGSNGYWEAEISGGQGPFYSTTWYRSYHEPGGTPNWSQVGTGDSYSQTVTHNMYLRAWVTDSGSGESAEDIMFISVINCSNPAPDGTCPKPKAIADLEQVKQLPEQYDIAQNYPNPFNPATTIRYDLPEQAEVTLKVYNIMGRHVATLVNEAVQAGEHRIRFEGRALASGTYIARMQAVGQSGETFSKELTMQLIK